MDIKKFIKTNLINLGILGLIIGFYLITSIMFDGPGDDFKGQLAAFATGALGLLWMGYSIYSNISVIKAEENDNIKEVRDRLIRAGNKRFFVKERTHLLNMLDSLESRKKYFNSTEDGKLKDLYYMTRSQMMRNAINVSEYIETFDYISGVDSGYAKEMCDNSQELLNKFNKLVELTVTYDDTTLDYDTREIDDMIDALQEMRDTGKTRLGS